MNTKFVLAFFLALLKLSLAQVECELDSDVYTYDNFYTLDEMYAYVDYLSGLYRMKVQTIGYSYLNEPIKVVKLCSEDCGDHNGMFVDALMDPSEWITAQAVVYMIQEIASNPDYEAHREEMDWYFLIGANPDGYAYTMDPDGDRMWTKNRAPSALDADGSCPGTNMNRNWGFEWGDVNKDASDDPCDPNFAGDYGFSEVETREIASFLLERMAEDEDGRMVFYSSLHAPGMKVLLPYGFDANSEPKGPMVDLADAGILAIQEATGNRRYTTGQLSDDGELSGLSADWVAGSAYINYAFEVWLSGSEEATVDEICPAAREALAFHVSAAEYAAENTKLHDGGAAVVASAALTAAAVLAIAAAV